jgi:hypothetical protein
MHTYKCTVACQTHLSDFISFTVLIILIAFSIPQRLTPTWPKSVPCWQLSLQDTTLTSELTSVLLCLVEVYVLTLREVHNIYIRCGFNVSSMCSSNTIDKEELRLLLQDLGMLAPLVDATTESLFTSAETADTDDAAGSDNDESESPARQRSPRQFRTAKNALTWDAFRSVPLCVVLFCASAVLQSEFDQGPSNESSAISTAQPTVEVPSQRL